MARIRARRILDGLLSSRNPLPPSSPDETAEGPKWVTVVAGPCRGARLFVSHAFADMANGCYDAFLYAVLESAGCKLLDSVVWDVGAHVGYHSLALAQLVGTHGHVLAFEPNPHNVKRLFLHLKANPELAARIKVQSYALGDEDGVHSMRISEKIDNATSSGSYLDCGRPPSDRHPQSVYDRFQSIEVQVAKADTIIRDGEDLPPSFVKVDVEGAEVAFLQGAHNMLAFHRPALAIEIHNIQCMFRVHEILHAHGYHLRLLDDGIISSSRCFVLALPTNGASLCLGRKA